MSSRFPTTARALRRDHTKYLTLIRAIALLHQHQRPVKIGAAESLTSKRRAKTSPPRTG